MKRAMANLLTHRRIIGEFHVTIKKNINMKINLLLTVLLFFTITSFGQRFESQWKPENTEWYNPVPQVVEPGEGTKPPSDAIILFDGHDLSKWEGTNGEEPKWKIEGDALVILPKSGAIHTKDVYGDCQLHIEWRSPEKVELDGQKRGNSGVFLQSRYEVQVLDCFDNSTYVNGQAGSIYKQKAPLVNACRKPGEWQTYDIFWTAPKFGTAGVLESPAAITVVHNGILIQNHYVLKGDTPYIGLPEYTPHGRLPLMLQDHNCPVAFRNIWIRNL